ncbi:YfiR family protein [Pelomonas sp. UHG3]|uniref:YfiR family protein n=1 Tax=Roseateles hydrophilus TaxID=2975054 RepID=A0ACC6C744_9BURK|nr:YfiR family protein [Pelomonas sp. UHG3]MCY4744258.1 YfiR family protein [Pelomonas sp. UHG3]
MRRWLPPLADTLRRCGLSAAVLLAGLCPAAAGAQSGTPEALKAEVVYRVLMFVTWPPERESLGRSLQLCTMGDGRVDAALQALAGRPIRQFTIETRRLGRSDPLAGCHLLYLPAPNPPLRPVLADLPVLVVSDASTMLEHGAMINLQIEDGRIVFDVELYAARRVGLAINTKLLRLARYVRHQTGQP